MRDSDSTGSSPYGFGETWRPVREPCESPEENDSVRLKCSLMAEALHEGQNVKDSYVLPVSFPREVYGHLHDATSKVKKDSD
jgi:hypothetical protein